MSEKTLAYYLSLPYSVNIIPEEDGSGYTAIVPDLPGCMTCADTLEELFEMLQDAKQTWIEMAWEDGDYIPEPAPVETREYSGKFLARIPKSLHRQLAERSEQENTSLNQLIIYLLSEGMGRWTERKSIEKQTRPLYQSLFESPVSSSAIDMLELPMPTRRIWKEVAQ